MKPDTNNDLFKEIKNLLEKARNHVIQAVNITMVATYFEVGKLIVEHEQKGEKRAEYGEKTLKKLSLELIKEFGKGFSLTNLKIMRSFYITYGKSQTLSDQLGLAGVTPKKFALSWSHYVFLMRLDEHERVFYETESMTNNWSLRELKKQFDSSLYERIILSRDKKGVLADNLQKYHSLQSPQDIIKDPYILEFLGLEENSKYSESELEQAIINNLEHFLLELGKGFTFVARQQRIPDGSHHYFIDLVFYNRLLQCFVIIDLKIGELKHQDIGQMQMYVNYYDRVIKSVKENKTIGIILCKKNNDFIIEFTLPKDNKQIHSKEYKLYLPKKEELKKQLRKFIS